MSEKKHVLYVVDKNGVIQNVQLSAALWERVEKKVLAAEEELNPKPTAEVQPEPVDRFKKFIEAWDFRYEYSPAVHCPDCGVRTEDWQNDPAHPFHLKNANIGGLLVFHCKKCGATVRVMHFKDHVAIESAPRK